MIHVWVAFSQAVFVPPRSLSLTPSLNSSAYHIPPLRPTKDHLGRWPAAPVYLALTRTLEAVIQEYGEQSSDQDHIAATVEALYTIELEIPRGTTPDTDTPIFLHCEPVVFFLEVIDEPWPDIKQDIASLVAMLGQFTGTFRAATSIKKGELRLDDHRPLRPIFDTVAEFELTLDLESSLQVGAKSMLSARTIQI